MTSYQNTSEFYQRFSELISNSENENFINQDDNSRLFHYNNESLYNNESHHIAAPENYMHQEVYPTPYPNSSIYDSVQREPYTQNHFYENSSDLQYNVIQYTPLTPEPVHEPVFHLQLTQQHLNKQFMSKKHRAQIKILPSSKGNFKAVVNRKRKRTVFTTEQVEALEDIFKTKQYINYEERQEIVKKLQLNDKTVKVWFQNRRLKTKRMTEQFFDETEDCLSIGHSVEERSSPDMARLNFVESQINNKTDEFGFVTLDEGVMGNLVNVIDDYLTKRNINDSASEVSINNSSPIYEPISPASSPDSNEDNSPCWKPSEPNEAFQRLFDLQTILSL